MLSREQNELLTRTGPGTPLGDVMRRYWLPAALSSELPEPDCPPIRVRLLGERLVAFRATDGRVGLVDEFCAHRRASLFLGRNEEQGLRCVFHGWKYDVDGKCVDMPNEPPETQFKEKIRLVAYSTVELGGVLWAYLGAKERTPPLPKFEWTQVPEGYRYVSKTWQECNWLQALEGGIDSLHAAFLHRKISRESNRTGISPNSYSVRARAVKVDVEVTDYGLVYAAVGSVGTEDFVRTVHYVMPFHQLRAYRMGSGANVKSIWRGHIWVPMDDTNCMVYNWMYDLKESMAETEELERGSGRGQGEQRPDFRSVRNQNNNWLIDRKIQKSETFTGIEGTNTQDEAVQVSMGPVVDRSQEHLGSTDRAIIVARRLLLEATKKVQEGGDPPGLSESYYHIRGVDKLLPDGARWRDSLRDEMYATAEIPS